MPSSDLYVSCDAEIWSASCHYIKSLFSSCLIAMHWFTDQITEEGHHPTDWREGTEKYWKRENAEWESSTTQTVWTLCTGFAGCYLWLHSRLLSKLLWLDSLHARVDFYRICAKNNIKKSMLWMRNDTTLKLKWKKMKWR